MHYVADRALNVEIRAHFAGVKPYHEPSRESRIMPDVTVVYWRDIPAQVIVGKGRRGAKVQLPERFEQAIDRAAMKSGAAETDDYLAEWRKAAPYAWARDLTRPRYLVRLPGRACETPAPTSKP